jgi:hypothetical protein
MTIKKNNSRFIVAGILIVAAIFVIYYFRRHENADKVLLQTQAIQTNLGWGYNITANGKIYIHQEFIPAIAGKHAFRTREDAIKVGQLVIEKISSNQLPTISIQDLKELNVLADSLR